MTQKIKLRKRNVDYLLLRDTLFSMRAAQPVKKRPKMPFKDLSADTECANKRESALEMIQYYYSIFDISVRGRPMPRFHLTELRSIERKFVRTLFPA